MKMQEQPGCEKCLEFENGATLHCTPNFGLLGDSYGVNACINVSLGSNGGDLTVVLPIASKSEAEILNNYIMDALNVMEKSQELFDKKF